MRYYAPDGTAYDEPQTGEDGTVFTRPGVLVDQAREWYVNRALRGVGPKFTRCVRCGFKFIRPHCQYESACRIRQTVDPSYCQPVRRAPAAG